MCEADVQLARVQKPSFQIRETREKSSVMNSKELDLYVLGLNIKALLNIL